MLAADEALAAHLVSAVVEPGEVLGRALELAAQIAVAPRANLLRTKAKAQAGARIDPASGTLDL